MSASFFKMFFNQRVEIRYQREYINSYHTVNLPLGGATLWLGINKQAGPVSSIVTVEGPLFCCHEHKIPHYIDISNDITTIYGKICMFFWQFFFQLYLINSALRAFIIKKAVAWAFEHLDCVGRFSKNFENCHCDSQRFLCFYSGITERSSKGLRGGIIQTWWSLLTGNKRRSGVAEVLCDPCSGGCKT